MGVREAAIRLRGLSFSYNSDRPVLDRLDLELARGERLGVIGHNGSGKTTLLHLIVGLLAPSAGEIEVFGKARVSEADFLDVRTRVGLLFQDSEDQLFSPTVGEDVAFGPLNLGRGKEEATRIASEKLAAVGLAGFEERISYRLSTGEKRLVSLAGVLAMEPEVLLLDEPSAGLDEDAEARILEILGALQMGMIVISHDRDFLRGLCSRVVRLQGGKIEPCELA